MRTFRSAAGDAVWRGPGGGEAVATGFVDQVPRKDGRVLLVQTPIDGVAPVGHGLDVRLVHGSAARVHKEDVWVGRCTS